jgi:hypothetical protein
MTLAVVLVVISQVKINVTNAYSGSLAWTNSFTRLTGHYPGRLVFLAVNLAIALVLMEADMFDFLNTVLGFYANCGIAWVVVVATDIAVNKYLLGISPKAPEFRRGMLYAVNPVGFVSMLVAAGVSIVCFFGGLGETLRPYSPLVAIGLASCCRRCWRRHPREVLPAAHGRRHRPAHVRRAREPVGGAPDLPRLPAGLRAAGHDRLRHPRRARLLAVPVHRPRRRPRPPGAGRVGPSRVHPRALDHLVDGVARPCSARPTRSSSAAGTARTAARFSSSPPVANRSAVKTDSGSRRSTARAWAWVSTSAVPVSTSTGWRNIGR